MNPSKLFGSECFTGSSTTTGSPAVDVASVLRAIKDLREKHPDPRDEYVCDADHNVLMFVRSDADRDEVLARLQPSGGCENLLGGIPVRFVINEAVPARQAIMLKKPKMVMEDGMADVLLPAWRIIW